MNELRRGVYVANDARRIVSTPTATVKADMAKRTKATVTYHTAADLPAPGARVGTVCGPCQNPADNAGTVLFHQSDRWGTHAVALMDDGQIRTCGPITTVGIGWYLLSSVAV